MYSSIMLHIFKLLCNRPPEFFHFAKLSLYPLNNSFFPCPSSWWTTILLSVSRNWTTTDTLYKWYKWNQGIFVFCDWLISLSIITSKFICVEECGMISSLLKGESLHGNRWRNSGNSVRFYFGGLQNHCRWWLQPWN